MKKVALYSSSDRTRKKSTAAASSSDAPGDASAPPAPPAPGRLRRFYQRFERPILLVAGALFAVALVVTYAKTRPAAHEYTQKDIDAAVLHTLETTQLPSFATKAFAAIEPSVVRVMGYGPETADDDEKGKDKDASKDKDAPKDKGTFKVRPGQGKDKLGRNDGGKASPRTAQRQGQAREKARTSSPRRARTRPTRARTTSRRQGKTTSRLKRADDKTDKAERRSTGVGTGVVIVDKGIILTNLHVVLGAERIKVRFFDGMEADAVVIARGNTTLRAASQGARRSRSATLRSTADLAVGDQVVAVGFRSGSARRPPPGRLRPEARIPFAGRQAILTNLIQFDAAANPATRRPVVRRRRGRGHRLAFSTRPASGCSSASASRSDRECRGRGGHVAVLAAQLPAAQLSAAQPTLGTHGYPGQRQRRRRHADGATSTRRRRSSSARITFWNACWWRSSRRDTCWSRAYPALPRR
jgi:S1-C subfamily serine protease